jgi:hypothetical protein
MIRRHAFARLPLRMAVSLSALAVAGSLTAMSDDAPRPSASTDFGSPSKLDYLVLASIADSPHLLTVAAYHSAAERRASAQLAGKDGTDAPKSRIHPD